MQILVLSTSLDPDSRSRILVRRAHRSLRDAGVDVRWMDLQELDLPVCDGATVWEHPATGTLREAVEDADGVLMGVGIYNFGPSAIAKTALELAGRAWCDKVVGFACAAGGASSYMSVMTLANALMLDFRTVVVPRFVYATPDAFEGDELANDGIASRIDELGSDLIRMTKALRTQA